MKVKLRYLVALKLMVMDSVKVGSLYVPSATAKEMRPVFHPSIVEREPEPNREPDFEVDLTEPLVGWKSVDFDEEKGILRSQNSCFWIPLEATKAECYCGHEEAHFHKPPVVHGSCGIYAVDNNDDNDYGDSDSSTNVRIEVYGWGRYVRGYNGWRSEFAYPKAIHLGPNQDSIVEALKAYAVPIYIQREVMTYDPKEDGYECRSYEATRNLGTSEVTDSREGDYEED